MRDRAAHMEAQIDSMMDEYRRLRENLDAMQSELVKIQATAYSEDGHVVVTVGPRGHLLGIRIDPVVNRRPNTEQLSASIMEAVTAAAAMAAEEVAEITERYAPGAFRHEELGEFDFSSLLTRHDTELLGRE
jgi:DNA-binding protein YbaB